MGYLSSKQAIELLNTHSENYMTPESLQDLVDRVSMQTPGKITIFYSGKYADISANEIVESMSLANDNIRIINNTDVSKLLGSLEFQKAAGRAFGISDLNELEDALVYGSTSPLNDFFYNATNGMWAQASTRFARETVGEVTTLTAFADFDRTFAQIELPVILANPNITTINGKSAWELSFRYHFELFNGATEVEALKIAFNSTSASSYDDSDKLQYGKDIKGEIVVDSRAYFKDSAIDGHAPPSIEPYIRIPMAEPSTEIVYGQQENTIFDERFGKATYLFDYLTSKQIAGIELYQGVRGFAADMSLKIVILSGVDALSEAKDAYDAGDTAQAEDIVSTWLAHVVAGSLLTNIVATEIGLADICLGIAALGTAGAYAAVALELAFFATLGYYAGKAVNNLADDITRWFTAAMKDPLVLDLDGNGINTVADDGSIRFDFDGDGIRTGTGWISPGDGLLVFDRNGNGMIDNGQELFGSDTIKHNGQLALDGFDALRDLDSNGDGYFDMRDDMFSQVMVWQDLNQDGIAQPDELKSLKDAGVASIDLTSHIANTTNNGNIIVATSSFVRDDGTTGLVGELDLASTPFYSDFTTDIPLTDSAKLMPEIKGAGIVRNLREAMSLSPAFEALIRQFGKGTSANQMAMLDSVIIGWSDTANNQDFAHNFASLAAGQNQIRFAWSWELEGREPTANELAKKDFLEKTNILGKFNGVNFISVNFSEKHVEGGWSAAVSVTTTGWTFFNWVYKLSSEKQEIVITEANLNIVPSMLTYINLSYDALRQSIYQGLSVQTRMSDYLKAIGISFAAGQPELSYAAPLAMLISRMESDPVSAFIDATELEKLSIDSVFKEKLQQLTGDIADRLSRTQTQELTSQLQALMFNSTSPVSILIGSEGNDILSGKAKQNQLFGGDGNDTLQVDKFSSSNNLFHGGKGNDQIYGSAYDDTYLFNLGDGQDVIHEYGGTNTLVLGVGITAADLSFRKQGRDFVITIGDGADSITLASAFSTDNAAATTKSGLVIESIHFADGSQMTWSQIADAGIISQAMGNTDTTLNGYQGRNQMLGGDGNDTLQVDKFSSSNNVFYGGKGNDQIYGSAYDDTYLFNLGDGQDVIHEYGGHNILVLGAGITTTDLTFMKQGHDFVIRVGEGSDSITLASAFSTDNASATTKVGMVMESIHFANGSQLSWTQIADAGIVSRANSNADTTLYGYQGHNQMFGGDGNDILQVDKFGSSNNIFYGGKGNDQIYGSAYDDTYLFNQGDGQDVIHEYGGKDKLIFGENISENDIWLSKKGQDLELSFTANDDKVTVANWFSGTTYHIEEITTASGKTLKDSQVQALVESMAAFSPPSSGQSILTPAQQHQLDVVIAASWK